MHGDTVNDHSNERMPFMFSFSTLRYERFGAIVYNPYLDAEIRLDPVQAYIAGLCNGSRSGRQIEIATRRHFGLEANESKKSVYQTLKMLSDIFTLGFCEEAKSSGVILPKVRKYSNGGPYLSAPRMVTWEVTNACNLRCSHCYNKSGVARDCELSLQDAFALIDKLADAQVLRLMISGGEPFLRPDIIPILRKASETKMRLDIATNGVVLPTKVLKAMRELPVFHVHVSIDGIGDTHDTFRGRKGAYEAACKNIRRLIDENILVSLSTTVTKENLDELENIMNLALDLGCSGFFANAMLPAGRGVDCVDRFKMNKSGYRRMYKMLVDKGKELMGRLAISTDMCFPFLLSDNPLENVSGGPMGCSAGLDTLCIGADGTVYPCHLLRDMPLGNIQDTSLKSLWKDPPALRELRDLQKKDMKEPCRSCRFAPYPCVGGCRAAAYLEHGDLRAMDPTCFVSMPGSKISHRSEDSYN